MIEKRTFIIVCVFSLLMQISTSQAESVVTASQGKCVCMDLTNPATEDTVLTDTRLRTRSSVNTNYKSWLQFDLNSVYAANPDLKGHIKSAILTLTGTADNTQSKLYVVNGLNDAADMENWNPATLTWNNAPGNNTADSYLNPSVTTANLYTGTIQPGSGTTDSQTSEAFVSFLNTDSDGLVTFIMTPGWTTYFYNAGSAYPPTLTLSANPQIAFPGAEGFGKDALGGRGGVVYEVTNLNDSGTGSLRAAIEASGPRIVVFRVSGYIELQSALTINNPYITIAGQTAPGDGICLKNYNLSVVADHVIIRYLRVRLGDDMRQERDSVWVGAGHHIILDHCSTSWAVDETLSVTNEPNVLGDVTVQWCMITESLNYSVHEKGAHGFGSLNRGGWGNGYSFHHNLYANHKGRNPYSGNYNSYLTDPQGLIFDFRNNVVYNWGSYAGINGDPDSVNKMNYISNYYITGPDSTNTYAFLQNSTNIYNRAYWSSNAMDGYIPPDQWSLVRLDGYTEQQKAAYKLSSPLLVPPVRTDDAITAYEAVLADAGATYPVRDEVDARVIDGVINKTGRIINCVDGDNYYFPTAYTQTATSNTITLAANASTYDNCYNGWDIEILAGTGAGQIRTVSSYSGITKVATVSQVWNIIPDATSMYGRIVKCSENAGGWPVLASGTPLTDTDHDGMPDAWESAMCLDPNNPNDGNHYRNDGYTNIEAYINWLPLGEPVPVRTDLNCDGIVNFTDFSDFAYHWLSFYGSGLYDETYDFSHNDIIAIEDLLIMAEHWLK
mgnify:CR=1 FL=1